MASETTCVALASAAAERSRASASRKAASRRPSASRIAAALLPSARVTCAWRSPSASVITARRSRSAFICRVMALVMSGGGCRSLISMRATFTPQGPVAWSITVSRRVLMPSRWLSTSSSSMEPTTVRRLVITSWVMACSSVETR